MSDHKKRTRFSVGLTADEYTQEELEFLAAVDDYRREFRRPFLTTCEFLMVLKSMGYRKTWASHPLRRKK